VSFWSAYALKLALIALLLAGLYALAGLLRRARFFDGGDSRLVTVVESVMLSPHLWVHVVKVGTRYLCVGGSEAAIAMLAELTPGEVAARRASASRSRRSARSCCRAVRECRFHDRLPRSSPSVPNSRSESDSNGELSVSR
jgi:flagellar biogenesis protein FliO